MLFYLLLVAAELPKELDFHKKDIEKFERETKKHKERYIDSEEFNIFIKFISDANLKYLYISHGNVICNELNCDYYMANKIFNFCYFIFDSHASLTTTLFKHVLSTESSNALDRLILKLHFLFVNGTKLREIYQKDKSLYKFYENKDFLGSFYKKSISKYLSKDDESDRYCPCDLRGYQKFLYKIYTVEFDYTVHKIHKFKNQHINLLSILPRLEYNETIYLLITKNEFIKGKKNIIDKSKKFKKVKTRDVSKVQSEIIKQLILFMDHRFTFENYAYVEYFLYFLKYFCLKANLHVSLIVEVFEGEIAKCQILSLEGTNIENLMAYYSKVVDKTKIMKEYISGNIKRDNVHSFTTFIEQNIYSFDSSEGDSMGEQDCLLLSCQHFLGYESKEEWFNNFMQRCAYCHLYTTPIAYFRTKIFKTLEPTN